MENKLILTLPHYQALPTIGLYMDQVLGMVEQYTSSFVDQPITKSMVNSYVKKGVIEKPTGKKYSQTQLAEIILIVLYKPIFSLPAISKVLSQARSANEVSQIFDIVVDHFNAQLRKVTEQSPQNEDLLAQSAELLASRLVIEHRINLL
ncbi:hypothetical protein PL11_001135 [Lentilactobacillus curieae]|uniref:DUF1836 domain-containing protein n=1 Tax=Lentilactobacillus curieae TaxID=1138822 RepID=A0A1S6QG82_9LACO|nr:DUF1836 domain-containing protein [Lentilactobacillus curieae]AQW20612.1 hypothetical protein PL11_001135 [Lentilactobacillus curieae]